MLHSCNNGIAFHNTDLRVGVDELVLHECPFVVKTNFGLEFIFQKAFSVGIVEMHPILRVCKELLSWGRWSSKRRCREVLLVVEAIWEVAIAAISIILPHDGEFLVALVEADGDASSRKVAVD